MAIFPLSNLGFSRYPVDSQPNGYGSKRCPQRGPQVDGSSFHFTNGAFKVAFFASESNVVYTMK